MKVTYRPEGAEPREWTGVKRGKIMSPEAELIERHTGWRFGQWWDELFADSMLAAHALLYVLLKRSTPTIKWEDVQFCEDDYSLDPELDEHRDARDTLVAIRDAGEQLSDAQTAYLTELDDILAAADDEAAEVPKASVRKSAASAPEISPT